jgi:O-antigen/teichoic acid export membrane protein
MEVDYKQAIKNWIIYNGVNLILVIISMSFFYIYSYEVVSYFNPTNRYILSNLLQTAVFIPLLLAISIPLKQLILAFNYKKFYVGLTSITAIINLVTILFLLPKLQVYGVFYSLIATDLIVIIFYLYKLKNTKKLYDKNIISKVIK